MIGQRLGSHEVTAKLGEGGMGEVWRATDTNLKREVAIKVLPAAFTEDRERLARFEREAQLLAQLHHPNIASIFGLESAEGVRALVMELVEGPTLAERLEQESIPLSEVLSIAKQIAEALEEAHEKGIIHRDLKPQNIKAASDGKVKVLDFGLAKAMDPTAGSASAADLARSPTLMQSPTLTALPGTQLGVILGTAAYMAPEQARGSAVDKRADIWAFGVVLYEMLVGRSLFAADTVTDTLAGVLKTEIDFERLPEDTPPALRRLLRRCLDRNPKNRLHDIADARIVLGEILAGRHDVEAMAVPTEPATRRPILFVAGLTLVAGALLGGLAVRQLGRGDPEDRKSTRGYAFRVAEPRGIQSGSLAITPDGRTLVYRARGEDGIDRLWVRPFDALEPRPLSGTEGGRYPVISPDGRDVAFEAQSELRRVPLAGGAVRTLASTGGQMRGGAWAPDGTILIGNGRGVLQKIPASGGVNLAPAIERSEAEGANALHAWPSFLPDGRRFVFLSDGAGGTDGKTHRFLLGSLDGGPARSLLTEVRSGVLVDQRGFLLFDRNAQLIAQPLDFEKGELAGDPELVADRVPQGGDAHSLPVAVSSEGTLAYQMGSVGQRFDWVDLEGRLLGTVAEGEPLGNPRLSPDGRYLAFEIQQSAEDRTIWVLDLERGVRSLLSERGTLNDSAAWSPDSRWVYFDTQARDGWQIVRQPREGSSDPEPLLSTPIPDVIVQDVSPDGRLLLFTAPGGSSSWNLFLLDLGGPARKAELWLDSRGTLEGGRFSPDGRWIAFTSDESGRSEVYVQAVESGRSRRLQISSQGGVEPAWSPDGRRIFFRSHDSQFMASPIEVSGDEINARAPEPMFGVAKESQQFIRNSFSLDPSGRRLLVQRPMEDFDSSIFVLTNWRPGSGR